MDKGSHIETAPTPATLMPLLSADLRQISCVLPRAGSILAQASLQLYFLCTCTGWQVVIVSC